MCEDYLSDELMEEMLKSSEKPEGEELVKILDKWFGSRLHETKRYIAYRFLSWLIGGRVIETIHLLEKPGKSDYSHIIKGIREIGNKRQPNGAGAYIAKGLWGWLGAEIGNPSWTDKGRGVLIVELPTTTILKAYMEMIGSSYEENEFFRAGFFRKDAATQEQFNVVNAITGEQGLGARYLFGGGCWVSPRTTPLSKSVSRDRNIHPPKGLPAEVLQQINDFMVKESRPGLIDEELAQLDVSIESETNDQIVFPQVAKEKDGVIRIKTPHTIEVKTDKLYDITADPSDFRAISMKEGNLDINLYKRNIKNAGYHGYHRDHPQLGPVIAAFEYAKVGNIDEHGDIGIGLAVVILGKSKRACDSLKEWMNGDRGNFAVDMMRRGKYFPALFSDIEDDVCDFFYEKIYYDGAEPVWQGTIYDPNDEDNSSRWYPVQACEYEGVFFAWAFECDPEGYFSSLEATKEFISYNWVNVGEDRDY